MYLVVETPPATAAVVTADVRAHLRVASSEDTTLAALVSVATEWVEAWLSRALIDRTYVYKVDSFPGQCAWSDPPVWFAGNEIALPRPPLSSVTSVTYLDGNGDVQTLSSSTEYEIDTGSLPGRVRLRYGASWPSTLHHPHAVTVTYVAGYGDAAAEVPAAIRQALMLLVGHLYENREATTPIVIHQVPYGVEALLASYRCYTRFA